MRAASLLAALMVVAASPSLAQNNRYDTPTRSSTPDLKKLFGDIPTASESSGYSTPSPPPSTAKLFGDVPPATASDLSRTPGSQPPAALTPSPSATNELRTAPRNTTPPPRSMPVRLSDTTAGSATRTRPGTASGAASSSAMADQFRSPPSSATQRSPTPSAAAARSSVPSVPSTTRGAASAASTRGNLGTVPPSQFSSNPPPLRSRIAAPPRERAVGQMGKREKQTRDILERMLTPHRQSRLGGRPLPLSTAVASATNREQQAALVDAYWALTSAIADYYLGLAEEDELARLKQVLPTFTVLSEEKAKLDTRVDTSLRAARAAQMRLARLMGSPSTKPLPSDIPFTGPYRTRIESVFSGAAPAEARVLHELLPLRLVELQDAANAVVRSQNWVQQVERESRGTNGDGVVRAMELLALNRRAFVLLARDYNLQINRYTQLVAPERVDTPLLVAMLIRTQPTLATGSDSFVAGAASERSIQTPRR